MISIVRHGPMDIPTIHLPPSGSGSILSQHHPYHPHLFSHVMRGQVDKNHFRVEIDVKQFSPEDLKVKIKNNYLVIEGKHEERKEDDGFVSREFVRRFPIPKALMTDQLKSNLSSDGVLEISAPLRKEDDTPMEQHIPIVQTGLPAIK